MADTIPLHPTALAQNAVKTAIAAAAQRTGVDFDYLIGQARIESGLNPSAKAKTSSATGLFQFTKQTWLATLKTDGAKHGYGWAADAIVRIPSGRYIIIDPRLRETILDLRKDPQAASDMAAEFAQDNAAFLTSRTGREPEPVDLYLAHFLGAGGAARFLNAYDTQPDASAAPLFPAAANANRGIFYRPDGTARTLSEIRTRFAAKLESPTSSSVTPLRPDAFQPPIMVQKAPNSPSEREQAMPPSMMFRAIEAMPKRLSLDFAAQAYRRLSALDGGRS